jgi:hypothetical protein
MTVPEVGPAHGRRAGLHKGKGKNRAADDPVMVEAERDLEAAKLAAYVKKVVDGWPKLTDEQLDNIAGLLRAGGQ